MGNNNQDPWFDPRRSKILGKWVFLDADTSDESGVAVCANAALMECSECGKQGGQVISSDVGLCGVCGSRSLKRRVAVCSQCVVDLGRRDFCVDPVSVMDGVAKQTWERSGAGVHCASYRRARLRRPCLQLLTGRQDVCQVSAVGPSQSTIHFGSTSGVE